MHDKVTTRVASCYFSLQVDESRRDDAEFIDAVVAVLATNDIKQLHHLKNVKKLVFDPTVSGGKRVSVFAVCPLRSRCALLSLVQAFCKAALGAYAEQFPNEEEEDEDAEEAEDEEERDREFVASLAQFCVTRGKCLCSLCREQQACGKD